MSLSKRYQDHKAPRRPFLDRAREGAKYTLPYLLVDEGHTGHSELETPAWGGGAKLVKDLSAKTLMALLPVQSSFFRLKVTPKAQEVLDGAEVAESEVQESLLDAEQKVTSLVEMTSLRPVLSEILKHLIVAGNVVLAMEDDPDNEELVKWRAFKLDQFVLARDPNGLLTDLILHEKVSPFVLNESERLALQSQMGSEFSADRPVDLWTGVELNEDGKTYRVWQEVGQGIMVEDSEVEEVPLRQLPFVPLRWNIVVGEDYGRGMVEEHLGDVKAAEGLSQALNEGAAAAAHFKFIVRPDADIDEEELATREAGAVIDGDFEKIGVLQLNKFADFNFALTRLEQIEERLSRAFMEGSSIQRNAERVTATEIQFMATQLDENLGGVLSLLSQEMQLPMVRLLLEKIDFEPTKSVQPTIITGLDALGRGHEFQRLTAAAQSIAQTLGPDALQSLRQEEWLRRILTTLGLDADELVKSPKEIQQEIVAASGQSLAEKAAGPAISAAAQVATQQSAA